MENQQKLKHLYFERFESLVIDKSADQIDRLLLEFESYLQRGVRAERAAQLQTNQLQTNQGRATQESATRANEINLSERENEVLVLVASGYTRKDVGRVLNISSNTAAKHISNIYRKLSISSVAEATSHAIKSGLKK